MPRHGPPQRVNRRELAYKKRLISRKAKTRKIAVVSRKGQPQVTVRARAMKRQQLEMMAVASSWIADLAYDKGLRYATMVLKDGRIYKILRLSFKAFEEWYYAHSKGTFFNKNIRNKYTIQRLR